MKLVLHIGTHKTGSTALQRHLHVNHVLLGKFGIHYAAPNSALMSNAVADALAAGRVEVVREFFDRQVEMANRTGARAVLVSAENFYGMTFVSALRRKRLCSDAIEQERALVRQLDHLIPSSIIDREIVCYVRRPDHFAESWYNQHIKGSSLFDGSFAEFLRIIQPTLSYNSMLRLWADTFGRDKCLVRIYEECSGDICTDFLRNVLEVDEKKCVRESNHANERLSRELVEFKRTKNTSMTHSDKANEYRVFSILEKRLAQPRWEARQYQDFLTPQERADLLNDLTSEMSGLQREYNLRPFPTFDLETAARGWTPYPGLSSARRDELEREYRKIQRSWKLRIGDGVGKYRAGRGQRTARDDAESPKHVGLRANEFGRRRKK
jgi:hypothetical protein